MTATEAATEGRLPDAQYVGECYRVQVDRRRLVAVVTGVDGRRWGSLRLLAALDTTDGPDETVGAPSVEAGTAGDGTVTVTVTAASTRWRERTTVLRCAPRELSVTTTVTGAGRLTEVHLLAGRRPPSGYLPSGSSLGAVVSPNPDHPSRIVRPAVESATIAVTGEGSEPGVGRWLFTPAPWCLAVTREPVAGPGRTPDGEWAGLGLEAPLSEQDFTALHYQAVTDGFGLRLDYEGQRAVVAGFTAPTVRLSFGHAGPYAAIADHAQRLRDRGLAPRQPRCPVPDWWRQPIFCGWGAQCQRAAERGVPAPTESRQQAYERDLALLAEHGVVPGTITVDDKWQQRYADWRPDPDRWPDLPGFVADRHARGQRVLLWLKAWDPEGADPALCVRDATGAPVALDPGNPGCQVHLTDMVTRMLGPDGLDADGLKIDFTARTPSGASLTHAGTEWGARLLHLLLDTVRRAAKAVRPDALIVTHTPNPAFLDVTDMIRLNDVRMLDAPDPRTDAATHMGHRAAVVAAACPDVPVDSDGWSLADRRQWRAYLDAQPALGVPSLYYVDSVGDDREPLRDNDFTAIRESWQRYRRQHGLAQPEVTDAASGRPRPRHAP